MTVGQLDSETVAVNTERQGRWVMTEKQTDVMASLVLSVVVCILGGVSMWVTAGDTGIGWSILGLALIWNH